MTSCFVFSSNLISLSVSGLTSVNDNVGHLSFAFVNHSGPFHHSVQSSSSVTVVSLVGMSAELSAALSDLFQSALYKC